VIDKLQSIIDKYDDLNRQLSNPDVVSNIERFKNLSREHSSMQETYDMAKIYLAKHKQLTEDEEILKGSDEELKELVKDEISDLKDDLSKMDDKLKILLIPKDPNDNKNTILEIRSGTGGDEAALFAQDLYRMYMRFVERQKWKFEILVFNENSGGGIKEVVTSISGNQAFGTLKFESGVHRVQRVPDTESSGRVHTSAATVAVLPEADTVDININESELKIDTYRASGAGGQHVNKTESAIRITHLPSGLVVTCQDESSQHKNRDKAMKVLRSRLYEVEQEKQSKKRADARKSMVSTGDRSAKIRTYNFPQGRVTDHRINLTLYKLNEIIDGDLFELIDALKLQEQQILLESEAS